MSRICSLFALFAAATTVQAQARVLLRESLSAGARHHISSRIDLSGTMTVPQQGQPEKVLRVIGSGKIDYHERILVLDGGVVSRTIRHYERLSFERTVGEEQQENSLRKGIRRLVILRRNHTEAPYSPDGPLSWGEIDMVRTDVFAPALAGLLPDYSVAIGEHWTAKTAAVQELTDLDRIEQGTLTCTFAAETTVAGRRVARITITGAIHGVGEDGPARHRLDGFCLFDLEARLVNHVSLHGTHFMVDAAGKELGQIDGAFVLTRQPADSPLLSDDALRGLVLEPTDENTQMLYENEPVGIRLLHSRRWRIANVSGKQISLDEPQGGGILITLDAAGRLPTSKQYLQEAQNYLAGQKAKVRNVVPPHRLQDAPGIEHFGITAETAGRTIYLEYFIIRQSLGGAMLVARLPATDRQTLQADVLRLAKSVQIAGSS